MKPQISPRNRASRVGKRRTFDNSLRGEFLYEAPLLAGFKVEVESKYRCYGRQQRTQRPRQPH